MPEFDLIQKYLKPLASSDAALMLEDDAAILNASEGCSLVISKDMMVAGVHYDDATSPKQLAQKLLRVNLSDLAAMGARPLGYLLGLSLPDSMSGAEREAWLVDFTSGLMADQKLYDISLLGGDTVSAYGQMVLSLTIVGEVPVGKAMRRDRAKVGDHIFVTGTLGDAALGLALEQGKLDIDEAQKATLVERLRLPRPRIDVGMAMRGIAHGSIDISDGLLADLAHVVDTSGVAAELYLPQLPLSNAARLCRDVTPKPEDKFWPLIYAGGDDYELLLTVSEEDAQRAKDICEKLAVPLTEIGLIKKGSDVTIFDQHGDKLMVNKQGYEHFKV